MPSFRTLLGCAGLLLLGPATALADASLLRPGDYRFDLRSGGAARSYYLHVPPRVEAGLPPLVMFLHGGGGNAQQFRKDAALDAAADRDGYVAVYPNGSGRLGDVLLTWNAGHCCGYAMEQKVDDVAFLAAVLDDVQRRTAVDTRRVYAAGHSNGGMMALRLGEALPDRLAAVASVAGAYVPAADAGEPPRRALPVLHIHSEDDPRAPYRGGLGPPFPLTGNRSLHMRVDDMMQAWTARDGCDPNAVQRDFRSAGSHTARLLVHANCRGDAEVALWRLTGAGHGWPGAEPARESLLGPGTKVVDANREIWRFFSRFTLP